MPENDSTIDLKALRTILRDPQKKGFVGKQFSRYDLISEIARGGMGVVFRAKHRELDNLVALKMLAQQDPSDEALKRFKREGRVLAKIKHDNIVGISDLGSENGISFLAMELIEGHTLQDELIEMKKKGKNHSFERAVEIALAMARALAYCHEVGATHRDVKPHNILVENKTGRPVLTDFGLVKKDPAKMGQSAAISGMVSQGGQILGTPSYMSPEQFEPDGKFGKVGPKSDVYGLGAVLFSILTGAPPFQASNVVELYGLVMDESPPKASDLREGVPGALDELVDACLTKKVTERIDMAEVVSRLEAIQENKKLLESPSEGSAGLRHALIIIAVFVVMGGIAVATSPTLSKKVWQVLVGKSEGSDDGDGGGGGKTKKTVAKKTKGQRATKTTQLRQVPKDPAEAFKVGRQELKSDPEFAARAFTAAAEQGHVAAMVQLGRLYSQGDGVAKSRAKALTWFQKAADGGNVMAMIWLGHLHTESEPKQALTWYRKASAAAGPHRATAEAAAKKLLDENPDLRDQ